MKAIAAALALALSACAGTTGALAPSQPGKQYRWLLGSGEAAILSQQAYDMMLNTTLNALEKRKRGQWLQGVVLAPGATLNEPRWMPCDGKPLAVVLDIDETAILNTGANYDSAKRGDPPFDPARWAKWEAEGVALVEPVPGALESLKVMRSAGVKVVFNSNRSNQHATETAKAIANAGLGEAVHGDTLFLKGDIAPGSGKDPRRQAIAARYCVVAMAGDNLGDFADAFNDPKLSVGERRALARSWTLRPLWSSGWHVLPNSMYGAWDGAGFDDLFPADKRWRGGE